MFFGQQPYATEGSLLEQVSYPLVAQANEKRALVALEAVGLEYLVGRYGLHTPSVWVEHLSGGEMQRLSVARLLFHGPTFAFLDEATNALDVALEQKCLGAASEAGVTSISVSQRETAWVFHKQLLCLDNGTGKLSELTHS